MQNGAATATLPDAPTSARPGFCERCDAPLYDGEKACIYCGGGASPADAQAVAVISLLVLCTLGFVWLVLV
jgi:hypothetical protein